MAPRLRGNSASTEEEHRGPSAVIQLRDYISKCWTKYSKDPTIRSPYVCLVQSLGYGKTHLLHELAALTSESKFMRVVYVCAPRFDAPPSPLYNFLFSDLGDGKEVLVEKLLQRVYRTFAYAIENWGSIGTDGKGIPLDELKEHKTKPTRAGKCVLIVALDEANFLLGPTEDDFVWFEAFQAALTKTNHLTSKEYGPSAGVFVVFADTNSKVSNFAPPAKRGSSREAGGTLFSPFILTHTVDASFDERVSVAKASGSTSTSFYRDLVCEQDEDIRWRTLVQMGRPLWSTMNTTGKDTLVSLAATSLLRGMNIGDEKNFNETSQFGVASILCRVGVRPYSWTPLASRLVSDFMATLVYASSSRDQFISTYSSEPVLTFGAARLWYATSDEPVLETKILPQLSKILHQEVMDTGGVGELVARIVLLMAMDATGFLLSGIPKDRIYAGEFRSGWDFLRVLHGEAPDVMNPENHDECDTAEDVLKKMELEWKVWKIGFSHFVQLSEEPDEDCLWSMLTRRAAAAFPRNFRGGWTYSFRSSSLVHHRKCR